MTKRFLGAAFSRGEHLNTSFVMDDGPNPASGRFSKTIRDRKGKVIGYKEHTERFDLEPIPGETIGVQKAVEKWEANRKRGIIWRIRKWLEPWEGKF